MRSLALLSCLLLSFCLHAQHPLAFATRQELEEVKRSIPQHPILRKSFNDIRAEVDKWLDKDVDVPLPKDPAGGYTHERHKANYTLMFHSGLLYQVTGNPRYAMLVKNILLKYALLNPTLRNHSQATSSSPGRIFWQALNDANWLVYTGMAYDLVHPAVSAADRKKIEDGAFKPEVDYLTKDLKTWFDLIHNHGVWACAGVGIVGIATGNQTYVDMALYGTEGDGKSGFLAQMNGLFSPDGYYTEGPYYVRYALLPFYIFANALHKARPGLNIFRYRDGILKKALEAGLQQTNTNGAFFPVNDALKEKDFTSTELVTAIGIAWDVYGKDSGLLAVAARQGRVALNRGGSRIAEALSNGKLQPYYPYKPVEYRDGASGTEGGISFLRMGKGSDLTTLAFKYASHGLSHGHYDQLGFFLYDKGAEVFTDYGSVRFVGVEQKWGGRYLPENKAYAAQTIAHNTIVADEKSHFGGNEETAERHHGEKLFSSVSHPRVQVVSAREANAYADINLQRTLYLLQLPAGKRVVVDLFHAYSATRHSYDLPFQYNGQIIKTSFSYAPNVTTQAPLGKGSGYQFLWNEAQANLKDTLAQVTILNGRTYYTISSLVTDSAKVFFTRSGANDPNFNLRREPAFIFRKEGTSQTFAQVIEIHGQFDPVGEASSNAYPEVDGIQLLQNDAQYTIAEIKLGKNKLLLLQCNENFAAQANHIVHIQGRPQQWKGPFALFYNNKPL